jgi:hypothetical protein
LDRRRSDKGKVTAFTIPEQANPYFFTPMRIVRWKILSEEDASPTAEQ